MNISNSQVNRLRHFVRAGLRSLFRPEPQTAVEWADANYYLPKESAYQEGRWETLPFQRAIMNAMGSDYIREVNVVKSARVGYSKMLLGVYAYFIEHKQRNTLIWLPTDGDAENFMKTHVEPTIRDIPSLLALAPWYGKKHRDNTLTMKRFSNGRGFWCLGGKAAKNYREKSVDVAGYDELAAFDEDIEQEGSPTFLGDKRIEGSVWPKSIRGSTPKVRGTCQIERAASESPHFMRFHVACPHCGEEQYLKFGDKETPFGLKWMPDDPSSVFYLCEHNACVIRQQELDFTDARYICEKTGIWTRDGILWFSSSGEEIEPPDSVTFHIWTAYSPFTTWVQIVKDWMKTKGDNSAQAAADSQTASANSATAAKKSETNAKNSEAAAKSSETNAKASETNAKSSETNAAKSAADALNYRNQAQLIVGDNIGLGSAPRDCPDISGNPSGYIGFMRIMSNAKGFPSIASGESSLTGFISQVDGTPAYTGVFQGWATRSLYTYRWNPTIGPQWTRHARKDEVIRFQRSSDTRTIILSTDVQADGCYLQVDADGQWGAFNPKAGRWQPLAVAQGGTGANDASTARSKLEVMFEAKTGLDANTNLNDIKGTTAGFYYQPMSANAKPELNYPIQLAGALLVQRTGANGSDGCIQSYFVYNNSSILYRRIYTSTQGWSVWKKIVLTERIEEGESTTYVYSNYSPSAPRLQVSTSGLWGCHNGSSWVPLPIGQGGTNAATVDGARTNLGLGRNNSPQLNSLFLDRYSDSTNTYTSSGILHTRLLATDSTVRLGADMYVETLSNEPGQLTIRFTYDGSTGASKYLNLNSEGNLIVDSAILKSTVEKPLQIRSANPAIRFNETDRPANTPTYTLIANAGDWFIQKRDYDDAGSVSNAIAYNFANDRIDVQNLKASGLITANSGIATLTGHDWNAQHTDNVDKFRSIAGSTNGPAGSMVLGGIHVQFSKNYAVQFG
ncbi:phage terminase large subunit family protein, partial [Escherichia coli]|uniref:phage terminase large subunit family protein n=3 Tax=Escherichia coli TaxID=562 RepID=UPI003DA4FA63